MAVVFLDTEFTGLGQTEPDLISLGLINESGERIFYAELPEALWCAQTADWTRQHVVPLLAGGDYVMGPVALSAKLQDWFAAFDAPITVVSDAPDYDFVLLKRVLRDHWPANLANHCIWFHADILGAEASIELEQAYVSSFGPGVPAHHALNDARALCRVWERARGMPAFAEYCRRVGL